MFIITKEILLAAVDAAVVAMDPTTLHVRLYKTPTSISIDSVSADFTEADFTGYAAVTLTGAQAATWLGQGAAAEYLIPPAAFQPTASTVTNICYGYYVTMGSGAGTLVGAESFDSAISMGSTSDQIIVNAVFGISDPRLPAVVF